MYSSAASQLKNPQIIFLLESSVLFDISCLLWYMYRYALISFVVISVGALRTVKKKSFNTIRYKYSVFSDSPDIFLDMM